MIGVSAAVGALLIAGATPGVPIPSAAFGQHVANIAAAAPEGVQLTSRTAVGHRYPLG